MTVADRQDDLRARVAEHLSGRAQEITEKWLERVWQLRGPAAFRRLSMEEAKNHVPELLASLGNDVREGAIRPPPRSALEYLRLHVEVRRDQGYDLRQVLEEFEQLPALVGEEIGRAIAAAPELDPLAAGEAYQIAYNKLSRVGAAAARVYAEARVSEQQRLVRQLSEFARTLEHEIRNPLNTAAVTSELLRKDDVVEDRELRNRWVDRLQAGLDEARELLGEIRRLSIAEEVVLEERWALLREVVAEVFENLQEMAALQDVDLRVGSMPADDVWVRLPHVKLAIRNLVANAIKYSDPEEEPRWVSVSCEPVGETFHVSVEDNGLGIPGGMEDEIFQPGVRVHPETGRGSGLGLSIVREVVDQRGGSISVESREGEGSTFTLELVFPLASGEDPTVEQEQ